MDAAEEGLLLRLFYHLPTSPPFFRSPAEGPLFHFARRAPRRRHSKYSLGVTGPGSASSWVDSSRGRRSQKRRNSPLPPHEWKSPYIRAGGCDSPRTPKCNKLLEARKGKTFFGYLLHLSSLARRIRPPPRIPPGDRGASWKRGCYIERGGGGLPGGFRPPSTPPPLPFFCRRGSPLLFLHYRFRMRKRGFRKWGDSLVSTENA